MSPCSFRIDSRDTLAIFLTLQVTEPWSIRADRTSCERPAPIVAESGNAQRDPGGVMITDITYTIKRVSRQPPKGGGLRFHGSVEDGIA